MGTRARLGGFHRDEEGEPLAGSSVFIYQQHTTTPISDAPTSATIYTHDSDHPTLSAATTTLPLTTANDGSWGLFTANAMRVDIKIVTTGKEDTWYYGQDIAKNPSAVLTIQEEGVALPQRSIANFIGGTVTAADDAANGRTNVTITGGAETLPVTIIDAKGDLIAGTAADTASRFAIGTNGHALLGDSSTATGLKWAAAPANEMGYAEATASQTGIGTSDTDLTGLTTTITVGANPIMILAKVRMQKKTAAGFMALVIYDSTAATDVQSAIETRVADGYATIFLTVRVAPAAGSRTYKLRAVAENNTLDVQAAATRPNFIQVIEVV